MIDIREVCSVVAHYSDLNFSGALNTAGFLFVESVHTSLKLSAFAASVLTGMKILLYCKYFFSQIGMNLWCYMIFVGFAYRDVVVLRELLSLEDILSR